MADQVLTPPLTPFEALKRHRADDNKDFDHDGWHFTLDGPQGCPVEYMASSCHIEGRELETLHFTSGEDGDDITETNTWIQ